MQNLDEFDFHQRLQQTRGPVLVLFSSRTCGTCRVVEQRLPESAPPGLQLFKVDVQRATALARAYEIFHLPSLLLFQDGQYHARLDCEVTVDKLKQAVDAAMARPAEEEP